MFFFGMIPVLILNYHYMEALFAVTSPVIHGVGMGRQLGYPTVNLVYPENSEFGTGVYACRASFADEQYEGVMHLGPRKTFDNVETFEVFLLDFEDRELYGEECHVEVLSKLRDVQQFENKEKLVAQIEDDVKDARNFFDTV